MSWQFALGVYEDGPAPALQGQVALLRIDPGDQALDAKFLDLRTGVGMVRQVYEGARFRILIRNGDRLATARD